MLNLRARAQEEKGFTLIELLVVILIIGILAAIAIPSFLTQRNKAQDAQAVSLARTAQTAMETYSTDNDGSYAGTNVLSSLQSIEPTLITSSVTNAFLSNVATTSNSYTIETYSPMDSEAYYLTNVAGSITRTCSPASTGGCNASGTW
jgi:type IV pilus assembly protein PilA